MIARERTALAILGGLVVAALTPAHVARADSCTSPELDSGGFCCPIGSKFDAAVGACLAPGAPREQDAATMEIVLVPAVTFSDADSSGTFTIAVNGKAKTRVSAMIPIVFEVDANSAVVRVDVSSEGYAALHYNLPIMPGVAHQAFAVRHRFARVETPNLSVTVVNALDRRRAPAGYVTYECTSPAKGQAPPPCPLDAIGTCRAFVDPTKCDVVDVRVTGEIATGVRGVVIGEVHELRFEAFPPSPRYGWWAVPAALTTVAGVFVVLAATASDARAGEGFAFAAAGTTALDLVLGGYAIAATSPSGTATVYPDKRNPLTAPASFASRAAPASVARARLTPSGIVVRW